jgi:hypothetical protein
VSSTSDRDRPNPALTYIPGGGEAGRDGRGSADAGGDAGARNAEGVFGEGTAW